MIMDAYIDARFERVERALTTLIDSIAKYNPSAAQAHDLTVADTELGAGLEQLQTHQNNHLRILSLRAATAALDGEIKATLSNLASTRKDITRTTITTYPDGPDYEISYKELLSYARRISRTTLPPHDPMGEVKVAADANVTRAGSREATQPGSAEQTAGHTPSSNGGGINGATTPGVGGSTAPGTAVPTSAPTPAAPTPAAEAQQQQLQQQPPPMLAVNGAAYISPKPLPEAIQARLQPPSADTFVPWPSEASLRSGSLALLQQLSDTGVDVKTYDPVAEEARRTAAEQERKEAEEEARKAREAHEARMAEERERMRELREREKQKEQDLESWRRGSMVVVDGAEGGAVAQASPTAGAAASGEKKQFQFLGGMDDDDDDDDE